MVTTKHASIRLRQRGIPPVILEWLLEYGIPQYDHCRGMVFSFDARSRKSLRSMLNTKAFARHSRHLNCFVVMGTDGEIITVGHRTRKFRRDR